MLSLSRILYFHLQGLRWKVEGAGGRTSNRLVVTSLRNNGCDENVVYVTNGARTSLYRPHMQEMLSVMAVGSVWALPCECFIRNLISTTQLGIY